MSRFYLQQRVSVKFGRGMKKKIKLIGKTTIARLIVYLIAEGRYS